MPLIAVATQDPTTQARVQRSLAYERFTALSALSGVELMHLLFDIHLDAVIVDAALPDVDAVELLRLARSASEVPILVLVAANDPNVIARFFDNGADSVASGDSSTAELVARLRTMLRPDPPLAITAAERLILRTGALIVDRRSRNVSKSGVLVPLTRTEYSLLAELAAHAGEIVPNRLLLSTVWGDVGVENAHYVGVYIRHLRAKLEDDPTWPQYLVNEWGVGYRLALLPEDLRHSA